MSVDVPAKGGALCGTCITETVFVPGSIALHCGGKTINPLGAGGDTDGVFLHAAVVAAAVFERVDRFAAARGSCKQKQKRGSKHAGNVLRLTGLDEPQR